MASRGDKGKEVVVAEKGLKRLRKGIKGSNSSPVKAPPIRRFRAKAIEEHGLNGLIHERRPKPEECNLTLVRELYAYWDTSFEESTKVKIRGQGVLFSARSFNDFLCTPTVDPS
ncbi:hypothetical protein HAX54_032126, partial [Datura stramonium]|nr:hypothetical protein [Datura stramonium]